MARGPRLTFPHMHLLTVLCGARRIPLQSPGASSLVFFFLFFTGPHPLDLHVAMPAEKTAPSKSSETRRATKPIMEKRRRARINQCLGELKTLILDALNKDPSRHSKLEKADILEMTVRHLQNVQRQQMAAAISTDPSVLSKFKAGFGECANEVTRYVSRIEGVDLALRQRLLSHLSNCMAAMNAATPFAVLPSGVVATAFPGLATHFPNLLSPLQSLSVQIPAGVTMPGVGLLPPTASRVGDVNNNNTTNSPASLPGKLLPNVPVIPGRLPNGDFAFLLPSQALSSARGHRLFGLSSVSSPDVPSSSSGIEGSRGSQSSWTPASPSSRRSASPSTSISSALSPTASDTDSDTFLDLPASPQQPQQEPMVSDEDPETNTDKDDKLADSVQSPRRESDNVWRPW